ncbi:MAG: diaminopimelate epimerase [Candidatus Lokiarchaeota archaeon]|nr:diaminopimelate epimerase [Candidatus Lokiarchaeota archaeon]
MLSLEFTKMHGIGNDFIIINNIKYKISEEKLFPLAKKICDRHFSIGADGILLIEKSKTQDLRMRIINSDGSEAEMCGNGMRCFAKYVYENGMIDKLEFNVETLAGRIIPKIILKDSKVNFVKVNMGHPKLKRSEIPMIGKPNEMVISEPYIFASKEYNITCVNMGNPHCVIYVENVDEIDINFGRIIENSTNLFPEKINVEFVQMISSTQQKIRVWERGAGVTLACGTGACASVVSSVLNGKFKKGNENLVNLPGGDLKITWENDDNVYLKGPAEIAFQGKIDIEI